MKSENNKYFAILILLLCIDIVSKIIVTRLQVDQGLIPNVLRLEFMENSTVYYSLQSGHYFDLVIIGIKNAALIFILWLVLKTDGNNLLKLGFIMILAGNLGNSINLVVSGGKCVDWIVLGNYVAINLADLYMLAGLILIAVQLFVWLLNGVLREKLIGILKQ